MIKKLLLAAALLGLVSASSFGQRPFMGIRPQAPSPELLLNRSDVRTELRISDEQLDSFKQIRAHFQAQLAAPGAGHGALAIQRLSKQAQLAEWKVLDPDQQKRLREVWLQVEGLAAVPYDAELQTDLELTDDQKKQMEAATHQANAADEAALTHRIQGTDGNARFKEDLQKNREELTSKLQALLSDEQSAKFKSLQGKPFAGTMSN